MRATRRRQISRRVLGVSRWQAHARRDTRGQALQREIEEELLCEIDIDKKVCTSDYLYDFGNVQLTTFLCHLIEGMPRLTEHECIEWVEPSQMPRLRWAPVDHDAVTRISGMAF